ncbi:hypothetical protein KZO74_12235, partial [Prevotella salivae]|uniref:hypothetical protein n=1 Tax=Segatella salivae TaxID=228604 RepID=UPI001C5EBE5A
FHSRPPTECATQGGISFPTTHGMRYPGWNFIPDHLLNGILRLEPYSPAHKKWRNTNVSPIIYHQYPEES